MDSDRVGRYDVRIADEVLLHLSAALGARLKVSLEVEAELLDGVSEEAHRIVTENARVLNFESHEFELD